MVPATGRVGARLSSTTTRHQALFTIKHCAPGGGLILSSSHSVIVRTPLANYRAMVDSCRERGTYPIRVPEPVPEPGWGGA